MSYGIFFSSEARQDLEQILQYYRQTAPMLVSDFVVELEDIIEQIELFPHAYQVFHPPIRRAPLKRFPYMAYYAIQPGHTVEIYALLHQQLSAQTISQSLKQPS